MKAVTLTIHYQSPADDPFKVPRPHRVSVSADGRSGVPEGGEIGKLTTFLGFCPTVTPDPDDWTIFASRDVQELHAAGGDAALEGWYAQFIDDEGVMFGYDMPISRVEVSEA